MEQVYRMRIVFAKEGMSFEIAERLRSSGI